ncbi:lysylphosphatidylglycerol synthase domain-containing protein [Aetokthonos hydrillicola Thurmond2011]|jgi:hypothetical protein|uniref:Lysylphosphatidylglycerol synthase domain-containing protein n=1 Tax=Aetokthonos hydrillicola Thurmond2011 TaxID=2712845 RepID=A0AAP5I6T9_9CYAN|nr:lysylphosphatidylglycerol synthase domain-containing protein [Aetokthonos hydrillicola]MBO3461637.1 UPF0104 family protein [Aetokthonos hydrillicola CCALA 1050]MBW4588750.1 flippase-like domain-containing protein [Aetokthonos hydrillicola CCALA 1050]MDR9895916.1 lysylphosphatidylglycerol synthase domain-containing protein [Aetokthonos hydrillicola Thurmond2011]
MKQILRWFILGGTLFFLGKALKDHWVEVTAIRIEPVGWAIIAIAIGVTLLAHIWAGWVWTWIFRELNQPINSSEFIQVYLKTNIAKYVPGNVWHYYGRIIAAKHANVSAGLATLIVLLEPLLMAAAALVIVLLSSQFTAQNINLTGKIAELFGLLGVLAIVHPRFLNPVIRLLYRLKTKQLSSTTSSNSVIVGLERYPLKPLLGELGFVGLRSAGFILTLFALSPLNLSEIPLLLGSFSFAWLLGLVVPAAPGGFGVFEATEIAALQHHFPAAVVISATVLYRLVSILAETLGASLAWLDEHLMNR